MAKGKYARWLTKEGLLLLEGWARDGLTDEQIAQKALSGDVTAQIYWLKNRRPDKWRDKPAENRDIKDTFAKAREILESVADAFNK